MAPKRFEIISSLVKEMPGKIQGSANSDHTLCAYDHSCSIYPLHRPRIDDLWPRTTLDLSTALVKGLFESSNRRFLWKSKLFIEQTILFW